ncbi:MAG: glycosyltransferase family 39 protein [Candidatus Rokubacteria bacterium]|nr:glycosyltransferase family 39 protein [Candidatus Rokubacteria bacterium]
MPLNRDEGEYAYVGQLMLEGVAPFAEAWNMRLPGIYVVYAGMLAVFGQTAWGVHLGLIVASVVSVVLIFVLGRRLFDDHVAWMAAAGYAVLSVGESVLGFAAYTEHFVVPFAVGGILLVMRAVERESAGAAFAAGVLLAAALLVKQPGALFIAFAAAWIAWQTRRGYPRWRSLMLALGAGVLLPCALTAGALAWAGVFGRFWFWTVTYAWEYLRLRPVSSAPGVLVEAVGAIVPPAWPLFALAALGLAAPLWDGGAARRAPFLWLLAAASVLSTLAGFYFRPHYFILLLPAMALLAGVGAGAFVRWLLGRGPVAEVAALVAVLALGATLFQQSDFLFRMPAGALTREAYHANPYPEAVQVARFLRELTAPTERVAVIGSEPEIYFYARRRAATGYLYVYPLMEPQRYARQMQEEMIRQIEAAAPRYLVMVWVNYSWMAGERSDPRLVAWAEEYKVRHFERVGVADIVSADRTEYRWGPEAATYAPRSRYWLEVLRRRS